ncbi:MAG: RagB/SusD family nutrient uptake outer membrane protein [Dysgonamonadaceae bacterium]|jgi:hypothetical protein|nr:RagB/SusD family nutrient uptake outer membrane protein [Dysgonamonadaceae bacterium]
MKKILIILLILPVLFGCSDFLEPQQVNVVYNEVFWKTQNDAEIGLLGIYGLYRGLKVNRENWYDRGDFTTGFFRGGWNGGSSGRLYQIGDFSTPTGTNKSWGSLEGLANWSTFYKVVSQANMVIHKIEAMPDNVFTAGMKDQLIGEAYFMRALIYFDILRIWGNAPYISEIIESSDQVIDEDMSPVTIPRTKDTDIAKNVLDDVALAVGKLKYGVSSSSEWGIRANKGSAEALVGHANMWMYFLAVRDNLPEPAQYLTAAINALESLKANGGYSLVDYSSGDPLRTLYEDISSESVFCLNVSSAQNESYRADYGGIQYVTVKLTPTDGDMAKDRASYINWVPRNLKNVMYPEYDFETQTGDIRCPLFFEAWDSYYNDPFSDVSQTATDRTLVTWMKKYSMVSLDPSRSWNEYIAYFAEANIPVFRYTDLYLLLAEAYEKSGQSGKALPIVNEIRSRAGLDPYAGGNLSQEILQQRICELIGEGQLFFDMVRNNYFPVSGTMDSERYQEQGYYWPVASDVLTRNKQIKQTPYWNGKTQW